MKTAGAWLNEGNDFFGKGQYKDAIACYNKVIEINPDYAAAYYNRGIAKSDLQDYHGAIEDYNKAIEINPDYVAAYYNRGNAKSDLQDYHGAIEDYNKAIEINPDFAFAYNNRGWAKYNLQDYHGAIKDYEKSIEHDPNNTVTVNNRRILLQVLKEKKLDNSFPEDLKDTYLSLIDSDFFNNATNGLSENAKQHYEKIYFLSLKILDTLRIKEEDKHEANVAHYTSKKVSEILLFDKKKDKEGKETNNPNQLQLNSVTNSNDIQEGKTLFNCLFGSQKSRPQAEQFVAFVACFMFNYDNLNQFRLYGKDRETKEEGTGVSIVMKDDFFSLVGKSPVKSEGKKMDEDDNKEPLFRCIYIDPETKQVASIGHRDFHTFYKTKEILYHNLKDAELKKATRKIAKDIRAYKRIIEKKLETVKQYLDNLKELIAKNQDLDDKVIYDLLLNLRYLVKHVAFKEEQECRIIKIKRPCESDSEQPINENNERFFVNYLPLTNCVKRVVFGPKATGMELFQNLLTYQKGFEDVVCYRSTSPLA